ncbi:MAG TPA: class I SAM-dependent methyltransferase, partial [Longimicrobiales bacterium]|nr:class I SAM-dependent methyltransferase [Longimicrobiales bacterium]
MPEPGSGAEENPLREYFEHNPGRLMHKWLHYFDIYHRHFAVYRDRPVTVVEVGVYHGGSLQMWKHYFGAQARVIGVDIDPACKALEEDRIEIHIGDQGDGEFLARLCSEIGEFHVCIDDGGHLMRQQITTFEHMFPKLATGGTYLVEDLHTSYWPDWGGGYKRSAAWLGLGKPRTFIEYAKDFIDAINAWHSRDPKRHVVSDFTRSA